LRNLTLVEALPEFKSGKNLVSQSRHARLIAFGDQAQMRRDSCIRVEAILPIQMWQTKRMAFPDGMTDESIWSLQWRAHSASRRPAPWRSKSRWPREGWRPQSGLPDNVAEPLKRYPE